MFLPALARLASQDHQLSLFSPESREMRNLHDHRPDIYRRAFSLKIEILMIQILIFSAQNHRIQDAKNYENTKRELRHINKIWEHHHIITLRLMRVALVMNVPNLWKSFSQVSKQSRVKWETKRVCYAIHYKTNTTDTQHNQKWWTWGRVCHPFSVWQVSLLPQEFCPGRPQLQNAANQTLALVQRGRGMREVELTVIQ